MECEPIEPNERDIWWRVLEPSGAVECRAMSPAGPYYVQRTYYGYSVDDALEAFGDAMDRGELDR